MNLGVFFVKNIGLWNLNPGDDDNELELGTQL